MSETSGYVKSALNADYAHLSEVDFASIARAEDREYFNQLPTSLSLSGEQVDRLIAAGRALLRASPEFQRLRAALK